MTTEPPEPAQFTVVIPTYNSEHCLERAVASALAQTHPPREIIIVDDASTDDTVGVACRLAARSMPIPIRVLRQRSNLGPSAARNLAWDSALGDYIVFLDADDEWLPHKLQIQSRVIGQNGAFLVGQTYPSLNRDEQATRRIGRLQILTRNCFWTSTVAIKRSIPERFCESLRQCEDHLLFATATLRYDQSYYVSSPLVVEHKAPIGSSGLSASLWKMQFGNWRVYRELLRSGLIGKLAFIALELFSTLKFVARPVRLGFWRLRSVRSDFSIR